MKLLEQIITQAVDANPDMPRLLRLCLILANKLGHDPLKNWATHELEGYRTGEVPAYRIFDTVVRGRFRNMTGEQVLEIPLQLLPKEAHHFAQIKYQSSISETLQLLDGCKGKQATAQYPIDPVVAQAAGKLVVKNAVCVSMWQEFNSIYLAGLIDNIKTKVLSFALEIESQYPDLGDSSKLPPVINGEKVANIFNTTINGTVSNFASGSQNFTQNSGIDAKAVSALLSDLRAAGVPESDVKNLKESLEKAAPTTKDGLVTQCRTWLTDLAMKAIEPAASDLVKAAATSAKEVLKPLLLG